MGFAITLKGRKRSVPPLGSVGDILRGDTRWIRGFGWCSRKHLFDLVIEPVSDPTVEQIRFVQKKRPGLGNYLAIREALCSGHFGEGPLTKREAGLVGSEYISVGLRFRLTQSSIWSWILTDEE